MRLRIVPGVGVAVHMASIDQERADALGVAGAEQELELDLPGREAVQEILVRGTGHGKETQPGIGVHAARAQILVIDGGEIVDDQRA